MRIFLPLFLIVVLLGIGAEAGAQSVPVETQGIYSGKIKLTTYETGTPVKMNGTATVQLETNTWELVVVENGGTSTFTFTGSIAAVAPYLFGSASDSGVIIGGRMLVKGKPGKRSLSGKLTYGLGSYLGVGDVILKVKKLPI